MNLLTSLSNTLSEVYLKMASNKFREIYQLEPRKNVTLKISKKLFKNNSFFGNLYNKFIMENNRLKRQQSMLDQTNSILLIIDKELNK